MTVENTLTNGLKTSVLGSQYKTEADENLNLLDGHLGNVSNPHGVTAVQAGAEPTLGFTPEDSANKGVNGGYPLLDSNGYLVGDLNAPRLVSGLIPTARLPYATESANGAVMLSPLANATAGTDKTMPVTPARVFDILNASSLKNSALNGDFDIWQRGTSFSNPANLAFTADRWFMVYNGTGSTFTVSKQAFTLGQTDVPNEPAYFMRYDVTVAGSSEAYRQIKNPVESVKTFAGQTVTLSFYVRAGSAITLPNIKIQQNFGTGGTPSNTVTATLAANLAITTAWQKFTYTVTLASISGKTLGTNDNDYLAIVLGLPLNSVFQLDIAQVQFELGEVATTFEKHRAGHELTHCHRYYIDFSGRTINGDLWVSWPTQMRSAPTLTATVGTAANATVNGCTVNNSASAATTITAEAEM